MPSMPSTTMPLLAALAECRPHAAHPSASSNTSATPADFQRLAIMDSLSFTEHRPAFHPARPRHAEQLQYGGRHVFDSRILRRDFAVRKQDAGHQYRVHGMVAAPRLAVVFKYFRCHLAHGGIPRCTVAIVVSDDEVDRFREIRSAIKRTAGVSGPNPDSIALLIPQPAELLDQLLFERFRLRARLHGALRLAAFDV